MAVHVKSCLCAVACALVTSAAGAAEICVKCTGPDANYDCVVNKSGPVDTVTKLYCITALAKAGPHASCGIDRNSTAPCQGERKEFTIPAGLDGALGGAPQQEAATPDTNPPMANTPVIPPSTTTPPNNATGMTPEQQPPQTAADAPPKTVQEMMEKSETSKSAGNAAKSAGTALQKAGSAVGAAAKTSWKCLSSFFSKC